MKKIIIGLLIVAVAAGAYYFLLTKKTSTENNIQKELLTGKWKLDSLAVHTPGSASGMVDSNFYKYWYSFRDDGSLLKSLNDTVTKDTAYYELTQKNGLLVKDARTDSTGELFTIVKLNADSLIMQSKDSTGLVFIKLK